MQLLFTCMITFTMNFLPGENRFCKSSFQVGADLQKYARGLPYYARGLHYYGMMAEKNDKATDLHLLPI